jgi:von Willebrand factor type A domain
MIRNRLVLAAITMASALTGLSAQQAPPTIRSGVEVVRVPVSVSVGNRPLLGLKASDFTLQDNGVAQEFTVAAADSLDVDVTLVVDTSASVKGKALEQFNADVQRIAESLQPNDRLRLITFAGDATDVSGLQTGGVPFPLERITAGGATSLYNALAAALMAFPQSDRPQLVFGFSDGMDNMSFLDAPDLASLAGYSQAVLYLTLVLDPRRIESLYAPPRQNGRFVPFNGGPNRPLLNDIANRTGGAVFQREAGTSLSALFEQALDEFRSSYLLTFTPKGVKAEGRHTLTVRLKDSVRDSQKYTPRLRWRIGYEGK